MRALKMLSVLALTACLVALTGGHSLLMASHATHFISPKGPQLPQNETGCSACHAPGNRQCEASPVFADDQFLADTTVCDPCHSPEGAFDGVNDPVLGAKANWDDGVYEADGTTLKSSKERWCATCHDIEPANSREDLYGIDAPKVIGDNSTYGYYATGHGANGLVKCLDCHDAGKPHIDHEHRTYEANVNAYCSSYRLVDVNGGPSMLVPKPGQRDPITYEDDFALCFQCHNRDWVVGADRYDVRHTNFWDDDDHVQNSHYVHLEMLLEWDSDCDWILDSSPSCTCCHNVHGSPTGPMIRHGELVSTYGTSDKVPAFDFAYLVDVGNPDPAATVAESVGGYFGAPMIRPETTGVCRGCHDSPISYYRVIYTAPHIFDPQTAPSNIYIGGSAQDVLFTCEIVDYNASEIYGVTVNLLPLDGDAEQPMYDDGTHGDVTPSDGIYSIMFSVPVTADSGLHNLVITASDVDGTRENEVALEVEIAGETIWDNGGADNNWSTPENWDPDGTPGPDDVVVFNNTSNTNCTVDVSQIDVASLSLNYSYTGTVTVDSASMGGTNQLSVFGNLTVNSGTLLCQGDPEAVGTGTPADPHGEGIVISAPNTTVGADGRISANGQGFGAEAGPGTGSSGYDGGGGGHGGLGGQGYVATSGSTYGSLSQPTSLGSGGGNGGGGTGGGAIKLNVSGTLTIDGTVSANGTKYSTGTYPGGGSGGSVWLIAETFAGVGAVTADGGDGSSYGAGGGGGGRISLEWTTRTFDGTLRARSGSGYRAGNHGTIWVSNEKWDELWNTTYHVNGSIAIAPGTYDIAELHLDDGVTLECQGDNDGTPTNGSGVVINATNIDIPSGAAISAVGLGFHMEEGPGKGATGAGAGGGGGYGGLGGPGAVPAGGTTYGSLSQPTSLGSGGGYYSGGRGGGAIKLNVSDTLTINGTVSVSGMSCTDAGYPGGGAGGSVWLIADTLAGTGAITADGGDGDNTPGIGGGGGGAGGRIALEWATRTFDGIIRAKAGSAFRAGHHGTIWVPSDKWNELWNATCPVNGSIALAPGAYNIAELYLNSGVSLECQGDNDGTPAEGSGVIINAGNIEIPPGAKISADGLGFAMQQGPGAGISGSDGGGGGHGGRGGNGYANPGGSTYGSLSQPTSLGSGGGYYSGGRGGGAIKLNVSDTLTINGTVSANGMSCTEPSYPGGGAGGSVWLIVETLSGTGAISADGGDGDYTPGIGGGGGGGGGRIAVYAGNDISSIAASVFPGTAYGDGQPGTNVWAPIGGYGENNIIPEAQCAQSANNDGLVTISFKLDDPGDWVNGAYSGALVVDNTDGAANPVGDWQTASGNSEEYGDGVHYNDTAGDGDTFTWQPNLSAPGHYRVYAWWTAGTDRATDAPYTINYDGDSETVHVDQKQNGGQWNYLGTYYFDAGSSGTVVLSDEANGTVVADAVKLHPTSVDGQGVTLENGAKGWSAATGGSTIHYDGNRHRALGDGGSANLSACTWRPDIPVAGDYEVYAWWHADSDCATDTPYTINYDGGVETIDVNQENNGNRWNLLGTYQFAAGTAGSVVLTNNAEPGEYVIADAIKWVPVADPDEIIILNDFGHLDACTLIGFEYSMDGGQSFSPPVNGDNSECLISGWKDNNGGSYLALDSLANAPVYTFTWDTRHGDLSGLNHVEQDDVRIRFKVRNSVTQGETTYDVDSLEYVTSESFSLDNIIPAGYNVSIDQGSIDSYNHISLSFTIDGAEVGTICNYSVDDTNSTNPPVTGNRTILSSTQQVSGIDVSALDDGTLTLTASLTDAVGNQGPDATDTVDKDTPYSAGFDQSHVYGGNATAISFTFAGAPTGASYSYSVDDTNGATDPVTGSGTTSTATDQVADIDVSSLDDDMLTLTVSMSGQPDISDVIQKDTIEPTGFSVSMDQGYVNEANQNAVSFTLFDAEVGASYSYSIDDASGATAAIIGSGIITGSTHQIADIDVSSLGSDSLTLTVVLTDSFGNVSSDCTDMATKDTSGPAGHSVTIDQSWVYSDNQTGISFTLADGEVTATCEYVFDDSDYTTDAVTGTGTIAGADQQITGLDLSALDDDTLTLTVSVTDVAGNAGTDIVENVVKDTVSPHGLGVFSVTGVTDTTATFEWTAAADSHWTIPGAGHYEIWYGTDLGEVQGRTGAAMEWDPTDDTGLNDSATTSTTITSGLDLANSLFYFKIWAFDDCGNEATTTGVSADNVPETRVWDNDSNNGLWSYPLNWSGDKLPVIGDDIIFNSTSSDDCIADVVPDHLRSITLDPGYTGTVTFNADFVSGANELTLSGDLSVNSGTIICKGDTSTTNGTGIMINATNIAVAADAKINANGEGFPIMQGPGAGPTGFGGCGAGGGHGGLGGDGSLVRGGSTYGSLSQPTSLGSGGGFDSGGAGGGAVKLNATETLTINGTVSVNGNNSGTYRYPGGGSGGSIWLIAEAFAGSGAITADGGNGSSGGGGGGRIALEWTNRTFNGTIRAKGGSGYRTGRHGTIWVPSDKWNELWNTTYHVNGSIAIAPGTYDIAELHINAGVTLECQGDNDGTPTEGSGVIINATNIDIPSGASISGFGLGFHMKQGPGAGPTGFGGCGAGGGHGGLGGAATHVRGGSMYGSLSEPTSLGSGGGYSSGGKGGGAIKLNVSDTLTINGTVAANGLRYFDDRYPGGGAGGSVWLIAETLAGSGAITADGGNGSSYGGGGGAGGRIALEWTTRTFDGTIRAKGGSAHRDGRHGTIWVPPDKWNELWNTTYHVNGSIALIPGAYDIAALHIDTGATLECQGDNDGTPTEGSGVVINATNVDIESGGAISVTGLGFSMMEGPGAGSTAASGGGGGGHGGQGGEGNATRSGNTYGSCSQPTSLGSGGGHTTGGCGGGAVKLNVSDVLTIDGTVSANGLHSTESGYPGGGAGGSIWLVAETLAGSGAIIADGGNGRSSGGGGGGGGRIALEWTTRTFDGTIRAKAGSAFRAGRHGTIRVPADKWNELWNTTYHVNGSIALAPGTYDIAELHVDSGVTLECQGDNDGTPTEGSGVVINATNVDIESGAVISAAGLGFPMMQGPGTGSTWSGNGGGAGHGGEGGDGSAVAGGPAYGSLSEPTSLGSGGGYSSGGWGGGAVKLNVTGVLTIDGSVSANALDCTEPSYPGGGAGGSAWVVVGTLAGSGTITANGGAGDPSGGGGGGGRICISQGDYQYSGTASVLGGTGYNNGEDGTIYFSASGDDDGDGMPDGWELQYALNPTVDDSTSDGDADGLSNLDEYLNGTDPTSPDTDGDGISDGWEVDHGLNPLAADAAKIWDNDTQDGYWSNLNNWSGDTLPAAGDLVVFNLDCLDDCTGDDLADNVQHIVLDYGYTGTLTIEQDSINGGDTLTVAGDVTINGGALVCEADPTAIGGGTAEDPHGEGITIHGANITVGAGGHMSADGQGFLENEGPGAGESWSENNAGAGGGHGGYGGDGYNCTGGVPYGLESGPTSLGSGGGAYTAGGGGGGAMKLEATNGLTVDGTVSANGDDCYQPCGGGGAGGSLWMVADTLAGTGTIAAEGGNGCTSDGGGGSGGRIHIDATTNTYTGAKSVSGGTGYDAGDGGTIHEE